MSFLFDLGCYFLVFLFSFCVALIETRPSRANQINAFDRVAFPCRTYMAECKSATLSQLGGFDQPESFD